MTTAVALNACIHHHPALMDPELAPMWFVQILQLVCKRSFSPRCNPGSKKAATSLHSFLYLMKTCFHCTLATKYISALFLLFSKWSPQTSEKYLFKFRSKLKVWNSFILIQVEELSKMTTCHRFKYLNTWNQISFRQLICCPINNCQL